MIGFFICRQELSEVDQHLEEEMEAERLQALEMAEARKKRQEEFQTNYKKGLDEQRASREAMKLLEIEQREAEVAERKLKEEARLERERMEAEMKRRNAVEVKRQMLQDLEKVRERKEREAVLAKEEVAMHCGRWIDNRGFGRRLHYFSVSPNGRNPVES